MVGYGDSVVVDLFLIHFPGLWEFCVCLSFVMHYFVSFIVLQSSWRGRESWLLCYFVLQMYCYSKCSVALPHGAVGWSAVCDCVFS